MTQCAGKNSWRHRQLRLTSIIRRRTKTQGSFSTEAAGVTLLWSLVAFGQIRMRRIDGHRFLSEITRDHGQQAA